MVAQPFGQVIRFEERSTFQVVVRLVFYQTVSEVWNMEYEWIFGPWILFKDLPQQVSRRGVYGFPD